MLQPTLALGAAAVALLAIAPAVSAIPEPNTVKYNFERRRVNAKDAPELVKRQNVVNTQITNEYLLYLINVTVGTPPQSVGLQLDTGSSDIWFPASNAPACQDARYPDFCYFGSYNAASSSTAESTDYPEFQIQYVDGTQIQGDYVRDVLNVGSTQVTNLTMAAATSVDRGLGVMGIGFQSGESSNTGGSSGFTYPNIIDQLKAQGHINTLSYSLWLDDLNSSTGSILFGGVDTDKYHGSLTALPVQRDTDSGEFTSLTVAWTGLSVTGSGNSANLSPSEPQPAILDSGTTLLYLPDAIANSIYNGVGVTTDNYYGSVVPCSLAADDLTFSFTFGGTNGAVVNVSLAEFVIPIQTTDGSTPKFRNGADACQFGIEAAGSNPILFGDTFLRSAYVVYDLENLEIGLAQTNFGSSAGTGNVQAFSSGAGMPDASSTASAASVAQTFSGRPLVTVGATASGTAQAGATGTRSATFKLSATATSSSAASLTARRSGDRSAFAVVAVTVAAFFFGAMLI